MNDLNPFEYLLSERGEVAALLPENYQSVLEIGCSKGGFRKNLRPEAEIWGVEPNPSSAAEAAERGYRILVGTYDLVADEVPAGYFDVVVCNDVIEHMVDPDSFLREVRVKLKPGGLIVGSVPNVRYFGNLFRLLVLGDWEYVDQGILDRTHLRFFTKRSLQRTFTKAGYLVEHMSGINSDFQRQTTAFQLLKRVLLATAILASLGALRDSRFMQFGFRIRAT